MSTDRARRILLERLAHGSTVLLALHLALPEVPAWCDGQDADGRAVFLVGKHQLGNGAAAKEAIAGVLRELRAGTVPEGVVAIGYAPRASAFIAEAVAGEAQEIMADGPRNTGKTQTIPAILAALAERHARAGFALPLHVLWLHDSLTNAVVKSGRSVSQPLWGGLWALRDDKRAAVCTLAAAEMVYADFVGCRDETAAERLRAECHVVAAEELIPSLDEDGGIDEDKYDLALSSMRHATARKVAVSTTNPGADDTWPYRRFGVGGAAPAPGCLRMPIPDTDRLTPEEQAKQRGLFATRPDLQARLGRGEWAGLVLGATVAVGFHDEHIALAAIPLHPRVPLVLGHDGGLTPTTLIGQFLAGHLNILATLTSERNGTRQHLQNYVRPWLSIRAPWAMQGAGSMLTHFHDPNMDTPDQSNIDQNPMDVIRQVLGGISYPGAKSWPGRINPLLTLFTLLNPVTGRPVLQIDPEGEGNALLIAALRGRWFYPKIQGVVSRELPAKTHPASDAGDALCYLVGGATPDAPPSSGEVRVESEFDPRGRTLMYKLAHGAFHLLPGYWLVVTKYGWIWGGKN